MHARLSLAFLGLALGACSSQADKQLEAVKSARSVLAEWALVEEEASAGRVPRTYAEEMRSQARDQLGTAEGQLSAQRQAAGVIADAKDGSPDAAALHHAYEALAPLEDSLESS